MLQAVTHRSCCLFVCLFVCVFVCLFVCLFVCWFVCLLFVGLLVCWFRLPQGPSFWGAVLRGDLEEVQLYLSAGQNPSELSPIKKIPPVVIATVHGRTDVLKMLVVAGASVNECDRHDRIPLHYAAGVLVLRICRGGVDPSLRLLHCVHGVDGGTCCRVAVAWRDGSGAGDLDTMTYLIRNGANIFQLDHYGDCAIHTAASRGHPVVLEWLYSYVEERLLRHVVEWQFVTFVKKLFNGMIKERVTEYDKQVRYLTPPA